MELEIGRILGLPAHPLIVHGVVVLVPLATLGVVLSAVSRRARRHLKWATVLVAIAALLLTPLATASGEELAGGVAATELVTRHADLGQRMLPFSAGLAVASLAVVVLDRRQHRRTSFGSGRRGRLGDTVIALLAIVLAVGASVQVALAGTSGFRATWSEVTLEE